MTQQTESQTADQTKSKPAASESPTLTEAELARVVGGQKVREAAPPY